MDLKLWAKIAQCTQAGTGGGHCFVTDVRPLWGRDLRLLSSRNHVSHPIRGKVLYSSFLCTLSRSVFYQ